MTCVVATLAFLNLNSRVEFCGFWLIDDSRFRSRTSKSSTHNPTQNLNGLVCLAPRLAVPACLVSCCKTYSRSCHGRGRGFESRRPRHSFVARPGGMISSANADYPGVDRFDQHYGVGNDFRFSLPNLH